LIPRGLARQSEANVYVAGAASNNVFRISPTGSIEQVLDGRGDGAGNGFGVPGPIAIDSDGEVFVIGRLTRNIFRISHQGGARMIYGVMSSSWSFRGGTPRRLPA
jgi:hypothetical protein